MSQLRAAGFRAADCRDDIEVSTGVAHGRFIDVARVGILVDAYQQEFGVRPVVKCELWGDGHPEDDRMRAALDAAGVSDLASVSYRVPQTVGRARTLTAYPPKDNAPCSLGVMAFDPDGSVRPCCGFNYGNDGILLSAGGDEPLDALIRRMVNDPVMQALNDAPPGQLFRRVPGAPGPEGFGGNCDWCRHALPTAGEDLRRQLFPQQRFYPFPFHRV